MKQLIALAFCAAVMSVAACDDSRPAEPEVMDAPMEEAEALPAETAAAPVVEAEAPTDPEPGDQTLPGTERTSEESVQPESETLFY